VNLVKTISSELISCYSDTLSLLNALELSADDNSVMHLVVKNTGNRITIISTLKKMKKSIDSLNKYTELNLDIITEKIEDWIEYFNENYSSKSNWYKERQALKENDLKRFLKDIDKFENRLFEIFENSTIILPSNKKQLITTTLTKRLDKSSKEDLKEGIKAMELGLTTAAYMLFFRVAESQVKTYYTKITGTKPIGEKSNWGNMLHVLLNEHRSTINKNLTNLLFYLKDKRNEAQHPGKRFKQNDCEKILHYLSDLIKEISK